MSTKTTFKRIALVTVAALGFGLMSTVAPATAADGVAAGSISLETSSLTVVQNTQNIGIARISLFDTAGDADTLAAGETITATVIGVPAVDTKTVASNAADITFVELKESAATGLKDYTPDTFTTATPASELTNGSFDVRNAAVGNGATTNINSVYALALVGGTGAGNNTLDKGFYTIRFRLTNVDGFVLSEKTMKVKFVSSAADSGSKIAITVTGSAQKSQALPFATNNNISVSLKNEEDGRVQLSPAANYVPVAPPLAVAYTTSAGVVVSTGTYLLIADSGTAAQDVVTRTGSSILNGTYGVYATNSGVWDTATASLTGLVRVRYGATEATATLPLYTATTADSATSTLTVAATGINPTNTSTPFKLPITTKSAVFTVTALTTGSAAVTNVPITFTVAYSGNFNAGDLTPVASKVTTVMTDAFGQASFTVTNANPINGGIATVTAAGFASAGTKAVALNWETPKATTISISPSTGARVLLKAATVVTATVTDQFGKPVANEVLQPSVSGANAPATGVTIPTVTTGADGKATYTLTDAKAVEASTTLGDDTVNFVAASTAATAATASKYTYVATLPVVSTFAGFYDLAETTTATSRVTPTPVTGIYNASGTRLLINDARDLSGVISLSGSTTNELVAFRFNATTSAGAAAVGVITTVTISSGGYFVGSGNLRSSSRTLVTDANGDISFVAGSTATGAITITVTASGISSTAAMWVGNATANARFITITGAATGTANGALLPVVVTVTDRYSNPVSSVALSLTATGAAAFAGGGTTQTFTTDSTGTFTFQGTSYNCWRRWNIQGCSIFIW